MVDLRRHSRVPFTEPVEFVTKGGEARTAGTSTDISLGGMFVKTHAPAPFGAEVVVHVQIPGEPRPMAIPAVVRWVGGDGMGVQFGMIGARETHTITEIVRAHSR